MRPTVTPAELVARCEALLAWLAPRVERERARTAAAHANDNRADPDEGGCFWWERD